MHKNIESIPTDQLFEDGFCMICVGAYRLKKDGKYQEAYDQLGHVLNLLMEDRQMLASKV
jgi:hypothetical protein